MFSAEELKTVEELKKRYPNTQAVVLPVLWMVQKKLGHISEDTMRQVAELLQLPFGHILGVVSFYTMFQSRPIGDHHVEVCTNVSCMIRGSDKIVRHLEEKLGIRMGETSKDKKWTLSEVECMGACGGAPMCAVEGKYHENLTLDRLDQIVDSLEKT